MAKCWIHKYVELFLSGFSENCSQSVGGITTVTPAARCPPRGQLAFPNLSEPSSTGGPCCCLCSYSCIKSGLGALCKLWQVKKAFSPDPSQWWTGCTRSLPDGLAWGAQEACWGAQARRGRAAGAVKPGEQEPSSHIPTAGQPGVSHCPCEMEEADPIHLRVGMLSFSNKSQKQLPAPDGSGTHTALTQSGNTTLQGSQCPRNTNGHPAKGKAPPLFFFQ